MKHLSFLLLVLFTFPGAQAWQAVSHEHGMAYRLDGAKISGQAETGAEVYILIEPPRALPALVPGQKLSYRNVIFNYGDDYICGPRREIKIKIDDRLIQEREPTDGSLHEWHIFYKGFLTTHYGEVLTLEVLARDDGSDLAAQLLAAKKTVSFERKLDNCGDDGVFVFPLGR
jgi:hypothetical protein